MRRVVEFLLTGRPRVHFEGSLLHSPPTRKSPPPKNAFQLVARYKNCSILENLKVRPTTIVTILKKILTISKCFLVGVFEENARLLQ